MRGVLLSVVGFLAASLYAAVPPLAGDGVTDDTAAIQARLDAGLSCVYLPPPKDHYVISKALVIGSRQELRLDARTRIRLAPKSDCPMLVNRHVAEGDSFVSVTGGIWDYDNLNQSPNPHQGKFLTPPREIPRPAKFDPAFHLGVIIRLDNVRELTVRGVTLRNPTTYGLQLTRASYFSVGDVVFDYTTWNPIPLNMDGVHLDGGCHHGRISNLRGTCYDDLVALNANDGICSAYEGPIEDVDVDGIYAGYCHSAVRILSNGAPVRRINIRNIHGGFFRYGVGITHYFKERPNGVFDDICIRDCHMSRVRPPKEYPVAWEAREWPLVYVSNRSDVGTLRVENVTREESVDRRPPTVCVDPQASVRHLTVRDCHVVNRCAEPLAFLCLPGKVGELVCEGTVLESAPGAGPCVMRDDRVPFRR